MGMFNEDSNSFCVYSGEDEKGVDDNNENLQDKAFHQVMDDVSHQQRPSSSKHSCSDYKDECEDADNDSTASTIDSNLLHSSGFPSPALSSLQGQQYLVQRGNFDVQRTTAEDFFSENSIEGHISSGNMIVGPNPSIPLSVVGSVVDDTAYIAVSANSTVGDMTIPSSAACSVSTAPSTADEGSSIDMDSATNFDYFRLRHHDQIIGASAVAGAQSSHATHSLPPPSQNLTQNHRRIPSWEVSPHQQVYTLPHHSNMIASLSAHSYIPNNTNASGLDQGSFSTLPPQQLQVNQQQEVLSQNSNISGWPSVHTGGRVLHSQPHYGQQQQQQRVATFRGGDQAFHLHQQQQLITSRNQPSSPSSGRSHHMYQQQLHWPQQQHHSTSPPPQHRYGGVDSHLPNIPLGIVRPTECRAAVHHRSNSSNMANSCNPYQIQRKAGIYTQPLLPPSLSSAARSNVSRDSTGGPSRGVAHLRTHSSGGNSATSAQKTSTNVNVTSPHRSPQSIQHGIGSTQPSNQVSNNSRLSSEVLKTLLRKKACLYEPDTSRAVALVTWLVGRELALEFGYFSRQQLQAGVHACVTNKIDSGVITRTKVNRCMQIILNSCFHYIIPRPDGTEENGDAFRKLFAEEVFNSNVSVDSAELLATLPLPWRDMQVNREEIILASSNADDASTCLAKREKGGTETPSQSPRLDGIAPEAMSPKDFHDGGGDGTGDGKRAVLLCFNENVRRAEDVFRCHNEFIRDTAHASNLQLSSSEWLLFFGVEAANAPHLWGNVGIPVPYAEDQGPERTDALGGFNSDELAAFRTSWCSKRYDHNHNLCGFAHSEVNNGWLRRNTAEYKYQDEMCSFVTTVDGVNRIGSSIGGGFVIINECPHGVKCDYAHSLEEIVYHPKRYKQSKTCSYSGRVGGCPLGDVCPNFHPVDSYRFPKKSDSRSPRHSRQQQHQPQYSTSIINKGSSISQSPRSPPGTPILYASPAPISSFEYQLQMPGLQSLFRRQCAVVRAHLCNNGINCCYSCFGDDAGIGSSAGGSSINSTDGNQAITA